MRLGIIQSKQNELYDFENKDSKIERCKAIILRDEMIEQNFRLMKEAIKNHCDVIVTSEAINFCGSVDSLDCRYEELVPELDSKLFQRVKEMAMKGNTYIVVGAYNKRSSKESWKCYNSAIAYAPDGSLAMIYDKIHLAGNEKEYLTAGNDYKILETVFGKIGLCICWDMQFPEVCRELTLRGADLVVCPTWGWEQIYGHARAYENGIYVSSAMAVPYKGTITGLRNPSEVVSPTGELLVSASRDNADIIYCDFDSKDCQEFRKLRLNDRRIDTYGLTGCSTYKA